MRKIIFASILLIVGILIFVGGYLLFNIEKEDDLSGHSFPGDNFTVYYLNTSKFSYTLHLEDINDRYLSIFNSAKDEVKLPLNSFEKTNLETMLGEWSHINEGETSNLLPPRDCKVLAIYINNPSYSDKLDNSYGGLSNFIKYPFDRLECLNSI